MTHPIQHIGNTILLVMMDVEEGHRGLGARLVPGSVYAQCDKHALPLIRAVSRAGRVDRETSGQRLAAAPSSFGQELYVRIIARVAVQPHRARRHDVVRGGRRRVGAAQRECARSCGMGDVRQNCAATWHGVLAPAGTSRTIVDKLSAEIGALLAMPSVQEKLEALGLTTMISTPDQFGAMIKSEMGLYLKVVRAANIRID